jgi:hypothetical protein
MYLGYAGPLEANQIGDFAEPFPIAAQAIPPQFSYNLYRIG